MAAWEGRATFSHKRHPWWVVHAPLHGPIQTHIKGSTTLIHCATGEKKNQQKRHEAGKGILEESVYGAFGGRVWDRNGKNMFYIGMKLSKNKQNIKTIIL